MTMIVLSLQVIPITIFVLNLARNPSGEYTRICLLKRNIKVDRMTTNEKYIYIHRSGSFTHMHSISIYYIDYQTNRIQFSIRIMYSVLYTVLGKLLLCSAYHLTANTLNDLFKMYIIPINIKTDIYSFIFNPLAEIYYIIFHYSIAQVITYNYINYHQIFTNSRFQSQIIINFNLQQVLSNTYDFRYRLVVISLIRSIIV